MTTTAAKTRAHIGAEPAADAPTRVEEKSRTCRKDVRASIIAPSAPCWNAPTVALAVASLGDIPGILVSAERPGVWSASRRGW